MSTQVLLTVPDDVLVQVEKLATATQRKIDDVLLETISRSFAPFPVHPDHSTMDSNIAAYHQMHDDLVAAYLGQYVAISDGQLVDHDADPVALLQRVRTQYPNQVVLRRKVEPNPEPELRIRHPKIETYS